MNAPDDQVIKFKAWFAAILVGSLLLFVFITNLNLMLGLEHEHTATLTLEIKPGTHPKHRHIYTTSEGKVFERTVKARKTSSLKIQNNTEVKVMTDGLLWTEVVAVDTGKGYKRYR